MKFFKITLLVVVLAMIAGSAFTANAKVKKRRASTKKERKAEPKEARAGLDMVDYYFMGMMMDPTAHMRVERKGNNVVMTVGQSPDDGEEFVLTDGEKLLQQALEIIEEEKMLDYGTSYSIDSKYRVLDGYHWSFSAKLGDGRSISTSGSNARPEGDGLNRIHKLLYDKAQKLLKIED